MKRYQVKRIFQTATATVLSAALLTLGVPAVSADNVEACFTNAAATENSTQQLAASNTASQQTVSTQQTASSTASIFASYTTETMDLSEVNEEDEGETYRASQIILLFNTQASIAQAQQALDEFNLQLAETTLEEALEAQAPVVATITSGATVLETLQAIKLAGGQAIQFAQTNSICTLTTTSVNDPKVSNQYYLDNIYAYDAWDTSKASDSQISIAVIDTGVTAVDDISEQLVDGINTAGTCTTSGGNGNDSDDYSGTHYHGTAVAGVAAATANNSKLLAGVSYNANIIAINAFCNNGSTCESHLSAALAWLLTDEDENGVADLVETQNLRVVNMSFGYQSSGSTVCNAYIDALCEQGVLMVAAAGNDSTSATYWPSDYSNCVSVTATDSSNAFCSSFSNYGSEKDICAPGSAIYSLYYESGMVSSSGTSFSAPIVSAVASLVYAINPSFTSSEVAQILYDTATDLGSSGWDQYYGWGLVNAQAAVEAAAAIANCEHVYELTSTTAATCGSDGSNTYTCSECGHGYTETIAATGDHTWVASSSSSGNNRPGGTQSSSTYKCSVCGTTCSHSTTTTAYTAISESGGHYKYTACTVCTYTGTKQTASHTWSSGVCKYCELECTHSSSTVTGTQAATCVAAGSTSYKCNYCSSTYSVEIEATGQHEYTSEVTQAATCVEVGVLTYTCSVCQGSYDEEIPATGQHSYTGVITLAPTCTSVGTTTYSCATCSAEYTEEIEASGHTAGEEATCTSSQLCTVCGAELAGALGHTVVADEAVAATGTETALSAGAH